MYAPNAGTTRYKYDPFGRLIWQKDANGNEITNGFDNMGDIMRKNAPEGYTSYTYLTKMVASQMTSLSLWPTVDRSFAYNGPYNRLTSETSTIDGANYTTEYQYDDFDRVIAEIFPSGLMIRKTYFSDGTIESVTHNGTELFFATEDKNGLGQYMGYNLADGVNIEKYYNNGFITRIHGGGIQDLNMEYDYSTGNMKYRWDQTKGLKESFQYDELNRLISAGVEPVDQYGTPTGFAPEAVIYEYDGSMGCTRGNLSVKTDIGQFGYGTYSIANAKSLDYPTPVNAPPLSISSEEQKIAYTIFLKAQRITERVNGDDMELVYEYGPELQRTRSLLKRNGTLETTRVYLGNYEIQNTNGTKELIHYVTGGMALCHYRAIEWQC